MKIFRNARQKLTSENLPAGQAGKVTAYLRYAVGEILIVVNIFFDETNIK